MPLAGVPLAAEMGLIILVFEDPGKEIDSIFGSPSPALASDQII